MIIIRKPNGEIKTFMEQMNGHILEAGETMETSPLTMNEYADRLRLNINGRSAYTEKAPVNSGDVTVNVFCAGKASVDLKVNNVTETVSLKNGMGEITLSTATPGTFVIQPADKKEYFAGGEAVAVLEVVA